MSQNMTEDTETGFSMSLSIPAQNPDLYGKGATDDILLFLSRNRFERFTQRELADHIEYSEPAVRRAVHVLADNDLVELDQAGNRNLIQINRDLLSVPDDPFMCIPQSEFRQPVKTAVNELLAELDDVVGIVLYGSVARGEADRRSDIDLWVVVRGDRPAQQRRASAVESALEAQRFDGERYDFHIAVESVSSIPTFTEDVSRIVRSGIAVHETDDFEQLRNLLAKGEYNE
jgi:predicted nucleotidyltransferase